MSEILLAMIVIAGIVHWLTRPQKPYTTAEWCERMKELGIGTK